MPHERDAARRAAYYRAMLLSADAAERRLAELVQQGALFAADADEAQLLADRVGVTLHWRHLDLRTGAWGEGRYQVE